MVGLPQALWRNGLTITGSVLFAVAALFILSFLAIDLASAHPSPYIGLFTYLVFPGVLALAFCMILVGLILARRRFRRSHGHTGQVQYYPRLDLNDVRHRRALAISGVAMTLTLPVIGLLSYEGYHYTDSNEFCGSVCHQVMEPQFAAYRQSPHAHVNCAECHIGSGASWYVKSKLSGIRQVFAVALNTFPRPIPPAIQELRPATETCQQCHWPSKFYGDQLVTIDHYAADEKNTQGRIRMLLKTGGIDPSTGPPSGIHWHMALGYTVEYVAVDDHLQEIPWVKTTDHATNQSRIFRSDGLNESDPPPTGTRRTVDCMDCHNRPTHVFRSPEKAADSALHVHTTLRSLPFAKRELVAALARSYPTKDDGKRGIKESLEAFFRDNHTQIWNDHRRDIEQLVNVALGIYQSTAFPEMNVSWRTYPDNIGHKIYPGCFRCHDEKHVDSSGKTLNRDCGSCHEFLVPTNGDLGSNTVHVGGFVHPLPLVGPHTALRCDQCHTGGIAPNPTCTGCHTNVAEFRKGTLHGWEKSNLPADPMLNAVDCDACHDLAQPMTQESMNEKCMDCHSDEEEKYRGMLASWTREVDVALGPMQGSAKPDRSIINALLKAGPMHNINATREVLKELSKYPTEGGSK